MKLSNVIYRVAKKHGVNPNIFTAILAQESMYRLDTANCTTGLVFENRHEDPDLPGEDIARKKVCTDFGIAQIYYNTALAYDFDIPRLLTDLEYSVEAGAIVLRDFRKRYKRKDPQYWSRYNARNKYKRELYEKLVGQYL